MEAAYVVTAMVAKKRESSRKGMGNLKMATGPERSEHLLGNTREKNRD